MGHPFREAVERADLDAAVALLADDVVFRSPAVFKPYQGRETVATILRTVFGVFEDFHYTDELEGDGVHGLIFEARVGERSLQGLDLLRPAADGRIAEFTVMIRPASGLIALAERMGAALEAAGVQSAEAPACPTTRRRSRSSARRRSAPCGACGRRSCSARPGRTRRSGSRVVVEHPVAEHEQDVAGLDGREDVVVEMPVDLGVRHLDGRAAFDVSPFAKSRAANTPRP